MDSRLWSESLPEPSGERQVVLGLPESFRAAQNTIEHEFSFVKLAVAVPLREKHPKTPFVVRP